MRWGFDASRRRRIVALHEASHAAASILAGGSAAVRLSIRRHPGGLYNFDGSTQSRTHPRHTGFIAACGILGEIRYLSARNLPPPPQGCWEADLRNVMMAQDDCDEGIRRAAAAVADDVTWSVIERLSDELMSMWPDDVELGPGRMASRCMPSNQIEDVCRDAGLVTYGRAAA